MLYSFVHLIFPQSCFKTGVHDSQQNVFPPVLVTYNSIQAPYPPSFTTSGFFKQNVFPYILVITWNNFNNSKWRWKQANRQVVLLILHSCNSWQVEVLSHMLLQISVSQKEKKVFFWYKWYIFKAHHIFIMLLILNSYHMLCKWCKHMVHITIPYVW